MTKKDYLRIVEDLACAVNASVALHDASPATARAFASHFAHKFAETERTKSATFDQRRFFVAVQDATGADMGVRK